MNKLYILRKIEKSAWEHAKQILEEYNVSQNDKNYPWKKYSLQFKIYHAIKEALDLKINE